MDRTVLCSASDAAATWVAPLPAGQSQRRLMNGLQARTGAGRHGTLKGLIKDKWLTPNVVSKKKTTPKVLCTREAPG